MEARLSMLTRILRLVVDVPVEQEYVDVQEVRMETR